jgi:predicted metalloprotease
MLWKQGRRSENVEDRRGADEGAGFGGGGIGGSGGGFRLPSGGGRRAGIGGGLGLIVIVVLALLFGVDPSVLLQGGGGIPGGAPSSYAPSEAPRPPAQQTAEEAELADFVSAVLASTEDTWNTVFSAAGRTYEEPRLVLFSGAVQSACGYASAAVGPFYCPRDRKVYLDLEFFSELQRRFKAPGDFAQAYVIAHEVGHHVQNLLGIAPKVEAARRQASESDANRLSVMMELQADCLAGVWAHRANTTGNVLEPGDIEEALNAASAIGDDRLQRQAQGYVVPDAFTHGSAEQRVRWFRKGLDQGDMRACDTFSAERL